MNRTLPFALTLLLTVLAGCDGGPLAPSSDATEPSVAFAGGVAPAAVLGVGVPHAAARRPSASSGFSGPLFGLGTAPNGDILVADAGAGVATLLGAVQAALPGITDVAPIGRGSWWVTVGAGGDPTANSGQALYRASPGRTDLIADLFAFEAANDPDGQGPDSNPFDVASLGGGAALVADAGANALLRVDNRGRVGVVSVFPNELASTANVKALVGCPASGDGLCFLPPELSADPVPTSVAVGPDGYYYVGELKGFPAPAGESNVWRVSPNARNAQCGSSSDCVKVFDGGFTSIIDLAFGPDGRLYVVELDEQSWFAIEVLGGGVGGTINACDLGDGTCTVIASGIPILTAIAFDKKGALWATQNALIPGAASVVRVP